jgi:hypothetical protein
MIEGILHEMCFSDLDAEAKEKAKLTPEKKGMKLFLNW